MEHRYEGARLQAINYADVGNGHDSCAIRRLCFRVAVELPDTSARVSLFHCALLPTASDRVTFRVASAACNCSSWSSRQAIELVSVSATSARGI